MLQTVQQKHVSPGDSKARFGKAGLQRPGVSRPGSLLLFVPRHERLKGSATTLRLALLHEVLRQKAPAATPTFPRGLGFRV